MSRRLPYWTCRRIVGGSVCNTQNPNRFQKCRRCMKRKPKKRVSATAKPRESYDFFVALNGGEACGICGRTKEDFEAGKRLHRDHSHSTGAPRGLLCFPCNRRLPYDVDSAWLRAAANYLERTE